jgi:hypothetical protein
MKRYDDYTYFVVPVEVMFVAEMCVGVSASCMPVLALLAKEYRGKLNTARSTPSAPFRRTLASGKTLDSSAPSRKSTLWSSKTSNSKTGYAHMRDSRNSFEMDLIIPPQQPAHIVQVSVPSTSNQDWLERDAIYVDFALSQEALDSGRTHEYA